MPHLLWLKLIAKKLEFSYHKILVENLEFLVGNLVSNNFESLKKKSIADIYDHEKRSSENLNDWTNQNNNNCLQFTYPPLIRKTIVEHFLATITKLFLTKIFLPNFTIKETKIFVFFLFFFFCFKKNFFFFILLYIYFLKSLSLFPFFLSLLAIYEKEKSF